MKIAIVGLGYWGPRLVRNLVDAVGQEQVVAVDNHPDRLGAICRQYAGINCALSLEDVLDDDEITAVVLATPLETHAPLARLALEAGRHVLVEKPLASSVNDALELVDLAESRGLTLMSGHTFLFSPRVQRLAEYMESGSLGQVHYVTCSRLNLGLHRHDASVIWDLAPHDFSILFHLLGEVPVSIQTSARSLARPHLPEVAFMNLTFPSGVIASVTVSWLAPRKVRSTVIVGERQMIVYDDDHHEEPIKVYDKGVVVPDSNSFGEHQLTYRYGDTIAPHVPAHEPLAREIGHFLECIDRNLPCISDGRFGLQVVEALAAAERSWALGGIPVETGHHALQSLS